MAKIGVVITNIGTPEAPTPKAVRKYLREFLSDRRVISLHPLLWQPILNTIVLPLRSRKSAKLYQQIWTEEGSPLLAISKKQLAALKNFFNPSEEIIVALGMRYGSPSIASALLTLQRTQVEEIIILPLFPQYSSSTTASAIDAVMKALKRWPEHPQIKFIHHYYDVRYYIDAVVNRINHYWQHHTKAKHLLFSFHGLPKEYVDAGDPYGSQCQITAELIANKLNLKPDEWSLAFQSRFGPKEWLKPYCVDVLKQLPQMGIDSIDIVCPGFAADCLETLEEIAVTNKEVFQQAGGKHYHYIPALNDSAQHIEALAKIILENKAQTSKL